MNSLSKKYITPPADCTGCGLCANVCSQDAIRMAWNADGLYGKLTYAFEWGPLKIRYRNFLYRAYIGVKKWFR